MKKGVKFFVSPDDAGLPQEKHLFCELAELRDGDSENATWVETARWIKFEENVEESGMKWSKPHVTSLNLHNLFHLKKELEKASTLFDVEVHTGLELADVIIVALETDGKLEDGIQENLGKIILKKHRHLYEDTRAHFPHIKKKGSKPNLNNGLQSQVSSEQEGSSNSIKTEGHAYQHLTPPDRPSFTRNISYAERLEKFDDAAMHHVKSNSKLMRHIPKGAEAANVLVGAVDFLTEPISVFVRLGQGARLADLTEVPLPTRFVYILLGPKGDEKKYHEVGRCMSTLLSDERFKETAYSAISSEDLIQGLDQFMDEVIVLPPSEWDPSIRLEPPNLPPSKKRKSPDKTDEQDEGAGGESEEGGGGHGDDPALKRTGRLFGGLVADIKRKVPYYWSDYKDAFAVQSIASVFYIYMAALTPIITFGGVLQDETDRWMGTMEGLLSGAIACVTFGLFAGQPLNIIGSTGPMLVFERILYTFCQQNGLSFLAFRFWIGMWSVLYLLLVVAFDLSYLVIYITRFTEESFACLISVIFIYEAIEKVLHMEHNYAINKHPRSPDAWHCGCDPALPSNDTNTTGWTTALMTTTSSWTTPLANVTHDPLSISDIRDHCEDIGGQLNGCHDIPDVFLFSILIFLGTFAIAYILKLFRNSPFFPSKVRELFSDFNVVIAIVLMAVTDWSTSLDTPKLRVPEKVEPTRAADRGWVVHPFDGNAWWTALAGFLPAIVATILIFMDQQITAVIVNRKENKLKKGVGYHLDLMILAVQIAVCTVLGLPWFVASTVIAVSHVMSLRQESEAAAPGEKPQFLGVRENRLTNILVGILTGVSAYLTVVLRLIPMPVLYGVFLYMGVASLSGLQFIDRFLLLFMPQKYQPDYVYLRHVKTWRVHMFTLIQLVFFIALWVVKTISIISIAFPVMLLILCLIRKLMECGLFTLRELRELDDPLPEQHKKEKENMKKQLQQVASSIDLPGGVLEIPLKDGRRMTIPSEDIVFKPNKKKRGTPRASQDTEFVVHLGVDNPTFKTETEEPTSTTQL